MAAVLGLSMLMACKQGLEAQPRAVDIGGRRLFMNCAGKAKSPAVILEAGSQATSVVKAINDILSRTKLI
ncbi:MAG: hypothetical protein ACLP7O_01830 [Terracidiphilus sp.]